MTTIPPNPEEALVTISTPKSDTVRVRDRVESSRFEFYFDEDVEATPASPESIYFPVDIASRLEGEWSEIRVPHNPIIHARDSNTGSLIASCNRDSPELSLDDGHHNIEFSSAPIKLYLSVRGAVDVKRERESVRLRRRSGTVIIGARTLHDRPAGTIETSKNIGDIMAAVSNLSSSLKTTNPERSWPTLRGYPPRIELADELSIPEHLKKPDADIRLQVPETLSSIYEVASLAFYSAATIEPIRNHSSPAKFIAGDSSLELARASLGTDSANLLKKIFLLDCVTRTVGYYPLDLEECKRIEDNLPWDLETVYNLPIGERIERYLDVSDEVLSEITPQWPITFDIRPTFQMAPSIPHLVEELAVIRCIEDVDYKVSTTPNYLSDFVRSDGGDIMQIQGRGDSSVSTLDIHTPEPWDTQLHVSLDEGYPIGTNKTSIEAFDSHIERGEPDEGTIDVHVVCNDDEMREEEVVTDFYGVRDLLEFEVNIHYSLTKDELAELLSTPIDLIHYIGHIDERGIQCSDGFLDVYSEMDSVGADAFVLNACRSVKQGEALIEHGASGGIVTLFDVPNSSATQVGRSLSRLLNRGFNIRSALDIARESSVLGRRWISIGDSSLSLAQSETGVPSILNIERTTSGEFQVEIEGFSTSSHGIGTLRTPNFRQENYVHPRKQSGVVDAETLEEMFSLEVFPIRFEEELLWSDEISPTSLLKKD